MAYLFFIFPLPHLVYGTYIEHPCVLSNPSLCHRVGYQILELISERRTEMPLG